MIKAPKKLIEVALPLDEIPAKYAASRKPLSRPRHNLSGRACRGHIGGRAALPRGR